MKLTPATFETRARALSINSLIPDEFQTRILQVRGAGDVEMWEVGDVAVELEAVYEHDPELFKAVRTALADLADVLPKTVGEHKGMALFYPREVRERYPTLVRSHFRFARAAGNLAGAVYWLDYARDSADDFGGRPMPVRVLRAKMDGLHPAGKSSWAEFPVWDWNSETILELANRKGCAARVVVLPDDYAGESVKVMLREGERVTA